MQIANEGTGHWSAPKDYADFFRRHYAYVVRIVERAGIEPDSAEDVASEIMIKLMEKDILADFQPGLTFLYEREIRQANFRSFFTSYVNKAVRGYKDKQRKLMDNEWMLIDSPARTEDGNLWLDNHRQERSAEEVVLSTEGLRLLLEEMRSYLSGIEKTSRSDQLDMVAFLDAAVKQLDENPEAKKLDLSALREHFGCSSTAINTWMWRVRKALAVMLGRRVPQKRVRRIPPCASAV